MKNIKSFTEFQTQLTNSPELQKEFKDDPIKAIQQFQTTAFLPDTMIYRIVVGSLGLSVILVIISVVILSFINTEGDQGIPTILTAIASGAIGALAGLLAPSPKTTNGL